MIILDVLYATIMFQVEHFLTLFHENDELQMDQSVLTFSFNNCFEVALQVLKKEALLH